ncbi:MAG: ribonuclease J [Candidatus Pacebacteria bacterium]|nr:ribonuclease J [Candidatus Paceibacterota bacterium]MDD2757354.1 ribonuclease J [Candidatus Paceibacterota bacterium]MDD3283724.1 ribonuclease J [Candidatus Paceibacterota bacterium]MDD3969886.1 ribonuclease J [Candidatus Paceibacterota bacterium]MDD4737968.1 ribonuclease J [Candidatus Paceibacterota bacterium]
MNKENKNYNKKKKIDDNLKVIPLGGLGEVGRNMMLLEYKDSILIIDMGFRMPEETMPGIDYIIPDISYLLENKRYKNVVGVVITHGHYDHIGAVPYVWNRIGNPPIYAAPLAKGITMKRQDEFKDQPKLDINEIKDGSKIKLGVFEVEFFRQNHSIPDNMGLLIKTPVGNIVHTSDFKFDDFPVNEQPTDFKKLERIAKDGVHLLMCDSTGAEEPGHSLSEKDIYENMDKIFAGAKGRIIMATFSSLINRIQQAVTLSEKYNRKVGFIGHSMRSNVEVTKKLGYLKSQKGTLLKKVAEVNNLPDNQVAILCTGAQGEENAGLMKIATGEHQSISIKPGDTIVFSSSVIPGNERSVQMLKDDFIRQKANVFHYKMMDIHAGGHAQRDEIKQMISIMKPKFFMPVHGQYSMLFANARLAEDECGYKEEQTILADNGNIINITKDKAFIDKKSVSAEYIMVDGLGIGDVGEVVLRDRQMLAKDGIFVIIAVVNRKTGKVQESPDVISRGFVYLKESKDLLYQARKKVIATIEKSTTSGQVTNWTYVKDNVRNNLGDFLFQKTERRPMVLPVIIEV